MAGKIDNDHVFRLRWLNLGERMLGRERHLAAREPLQRLQDVGFRGLCVEQWDDLHALESPELALLLRHPGGESFCIVHSIPEMQRAVRILIDAHGQNRGRTCVP